MTEPKLKEIAGRINSHLKRIEADPQLNRFKNPTKAQMKLLPYWNSSASATGTRVRVVYVSYQGGTGLKKAEALKYLAWLDAGHVGRHWEALRDD